MNAPIPTDRRVWIVTDEDKVSEVIYSRDHKYWFCEDMWRAVDGEVGEWSRSEIVAWADTFEDASSLLTATSLLSGIQESAHQSAWYASEKDLWEAEFGSTENKDA